MAWFDTFLAPEQKQTDQLNALDKAQAAGVKGGAYLAPVLSGGIADSGAWEDELARRRSLMKRLGGTDLDERTGSFSFVPALTTDVNKESYDALASSGGMFDSEYVQEPSRIADSSAMSSTRRRKTRVTFGEYEPTEEERAQESQNFQTRMKWHRDFLSTRIIPGMASEFNGVDPLITWIDPQKEGQEGYHGDKIRFSKILPELNSPQYDNQSDGRAHERFEAILDGVYEQAGAMGLLPESYNTVLPKGDEDSDHRRVTEALDRLGAPRYWKGRGVFRNREQSDRLREMADAAGTIVQSQKAEIDNIINGETGWKFGDMRTGWSLGNALSVGGWDKEEQGSNRAELDKPRDEFDGLSLRQIRDYFDTQAEADALESRTSESAKRRYDYFSDLVERRYNQMADERTWVGVLTDAAARATVDEFVLGTWSTLRGIAGLFDSDLARDRDFWDRMDYYGQKNKAYTPEYAGDNILLGGLESTVELMVQQSKSGLAMGGVGAGVGRLAALGKNAAQLGSTVGSGRTIAERLTALDRIKRWTDRGLRAGQWVGIAGLNEADVAGQMAREYMARGLDPEDVGWGEKLALTAWYTAWDGMFNPFVKGIRAKVPRLRGPIGPQAGELLPPIWAGKFGATVKNWLKATAKDVGFEVGQEAAQQIGSNFWSAGRFGTFGMASEGQVGRSGRTDWNELLKDYEEQSKEIFWGTVFGAGGGNYGRAMSERKFDADVIKKLDGLPLEEFHRNGVEVSDVHDLTVADRLGIYESLRLHSAATGLRQQLAVAEAAAREGKTGADALAKSIKRQLDMVQANNNAFYNRATKEGKAVLRRLNDRVGDESVEFGGENLALRRGRENNRRDIDIDSIQKDYETKSRAVMSARKPGEKKRQLFTWGEREGDATSQMSFTGETDENGRLETIYVQNDKDLRSPRGVSFEVTRIGNETDAEMMQRALGLAQDLANYHADLALLDADTEAFAKGFLKKLGAPNAGVVFYSTEAELLSRMDELRRRGISIGQDTLDKALDKDGKLRMDVGGFEVGDIAFVRRGANQTLGEMVATLAHESAHVRLFESAYDLAFGDASNGEELKRICAASGEDDATIKRFIGDLAKLDARTRIDIIRGMLVGADGAYEAARAFAMAADREKNGGSGRLSASERKLAGIDKFFEDARRNEETLAYTEQVNWGTPDANAALPGKGLWSQIRTRVRHPFRAQRYYDFAKKYPAMSEVTKAMLSRWLGGGEIDNDDAMDFIGALSQREGAATDAAPTILGGALPASRGAIMADTLSAIVGRDMTGLTDEDRGAIMSALSRVGALMDADGGEALARAEALNRVVKELAAAGEPDAVVDELMRQLQDESVLSPIAFTQFNDAAKAVDAARKARATPSPTPAPAPEHTTEPTGSSPAPSPAPASAPAPTPPRSSTTAPSGAIKNLIEAIAKKPPKEGRSTQNSQINKALNHAMKAGADRLSAAEQTISDLANSNGLDVEFDTIKTKKGDDFRIAKFSSRKAETVTVPPAPDATPLPAPTSGSNIVAVFNGRSDAESYLELIPPGHRLVQMDDGRIGIEAPKGSDEDSSAPPSPAKSPEPADTESSDDKTSPPAPDASAADEAPAKEHLTDEEKATMRAFAEKGIGSLTDDERKEFSRIGLKNKEEARDAFNGVDGGVGDEFAESSAPDEETIKLIRPDPKKDKDVLDLDSIAAEPAPKPDEDANKEVKSLSEKYGSRLTEPRGPDSRTDKELDQAADAAIDNARSAIAEESKGEKRKAKSASNAEADVLARAVHDALMSKDGGLAVAERILKRLNTLVAENKVSKGNLKFINATDLVKAERDLDKARARYAELGPRVLATRVANERDEKAIDVARRLLIVGTKNLTDDELAYLGLVQEMRPDLFNAAVEAAREYRRAIAEGKAEPEASGRTDLFSNTARPISRISQEDFDEQVKRNRMNDPTIPLRAEEKKLVGAKPRKADFSLLTDNVKNAIRSKKQAVHEAVRLLATVAKKDPSKLEDVKFAISEFAKENGQDARFGRRTDLRGNPLYLVSFKDRTTAKYEGKIVTAPDVRVDREPAVITPDREAQLAAAFTEALKTGDNRSGSQKVRSERILVEKNVKRPVGLIDDTIGKKSKGVKPKAGPSFWDNPYLGPTVPESVVVRAEGAAKVVEGTKRQRRGDGWWRSDEVNRWLAGDRSPTETVQKHDERGKALVKGEDDVGTVIKDRIPLTETQLAGAKGELERIAKAHGWEVKFEGAGGRMAAFRKKDAKADGDKRRRMGPDLTEQEKALVDFVLKNDGRRESLTSMDDREAYDKIVKEKASAFVARQKKFKDGKLKDFAPEKFKPSMTPEEARAAAIAAIPKKERLTKKEEKFVRDMLSKGLKKMTPEEKAEFDRIRKAKPKHQRIVYAEARAAITDAAVESSKRLDVAAALPDVVTEGAEKAAADTRYNDDYIEKGVDGVARPLKGLPKWRAEWRRFWYGDENESAAGAQCDVAEFNAHKLVGEISRYNRAIEVLGEAAPSDADKENAYAKAEFDSRKREAKKNIASARSAIGKLLGSDLATRLLNGDDVKSDLEALMKKWNDDAAKNGVVGVRPTTSDKFPTREVLTKEESERRRAERVANKKDRNPLTRGEADELRGLYERFKDPEGRKGMSENDVARMNELGKKAPLDAARIRNGGQALAEKRFGKRKAAPVAKADATAPAETQEGGEAAADEEGVNDIIGAMLEEAEKQGMTQADIDALGDRIASDPDLLARIEGAPDIATAMQLALGMEAEPAPETPKPKKGKRKAAPKSKTAAPAGAPAPATPTVAPVKRALTDAEAARLKALYSIAYADLTEEQKAEMSSLEGAATIESLKAVRDAMGLEATEPKPKKLKKSANKEHQAFIDQYNDIIAHGASEEMARSVVAGRLQDAIEDKEINGKSVPQWMRKMLAEMGGKPAERRGRPTREAAAEARRGASEAPGSTARKGGASVGANTDEDDYEARQDAYMQSAASQDLAKKYGKVETRRKYAANPRTDPGILTNLAHDADVHVLRSVARNPNTSAYALSYLAGFRKPRQWVAEEVARRDDLSDRLKEKLAHHNVASVRVAFAKAHPEYGMTPTEARNGRKPERGGAVAAADLTPSERELGRALSRPFFQNAETAEEARKLSIRNPLIGVHGLALEHLMLALDEGVLIMPSIAVTRPDFGWTIPGYISSTDNDGGHYAADRSPDQQVFMCFDRPTIDNEDAGLYTGDAMTPTASSLNGDLSAENIAVARIGYESQDGGMNLFSIKPTTIEETRAELYDDRVPSVIVGFARDVQRNINQIKSLLKAFPDAGIKSRVMNLVNGLVRGENNNSFFSDALDLANSHPDGWLLSDALIKASDDISGRYPKEVKDLYRIHTSTPEGRARLKKAIPLYDEDNPNNSPELNDIMSNNNTANSGFDESKPWYRVPFDDVKVVLVDRSLPGDVERRLIDAGVGKVIRIDMAKPGEIQRAESEYAPFFQSAASAADAGTGRATADDGRTIFGLRFEDIDARMRDRGDEDFIINGREISNTESLARAASKTEDERSSIRSRAEWAAMHGVDFAATADEMPVLVTDLIASEMAYDDAIAALDAKVASGADEGEIRVASDAAGIAHATMNKMIAIFKNMGSSAGRALQMHRMAMFSDYTFAGIASKFLDANKGKPLTKEQLEKARELAGDYEGLIGQLKGLEAKFGRDGAIAALNSLLRNPPKRKIGQARKSVAEEVADAKTALAAMEELAPVDLADWIGVYGAIQENVRKIGNAILGEFKDAHPENEDLHMAPGEFLDRLKEECDKAYGGLMAIDGSRGPLTKEEYRDLYTDAEGVTKSRPSAPSATDREINRMLRATHMIYELDAVRRGEVAIDKYNKDHGTNLTEEGLDVEIERLRAEHDDALRASGLESRDEDRKTMPLEVEKTKIRNRIDEIRRALLPTVRFSTGERPGVKSDEELESLRAELSQLEGDLRLLEQESMTDDDKIARLEELYKQRADAAKREYDRLAGGGTFTTLRMSQDKKSYLRDTPSMRKNAEEAARWRRNLIELRAEMNPEFEADRYAARRILETERRVNYANYKADQLRKGIDPAANKKRSDQSWRLRPEAQEILKKLRDAKENIANAVDEYTWRNSSKLSKNYNRVMGVADTLRTYRASGDISGLGVQLLPYLMAHPEQIWSKTKSAIDSIKDPKVWDRIVTEIESDPAFFTVMERMGVKLSGIGEENGTIGREDVFRRRAATKELGIIADNKRNKYLAASERGFNAPIVLARWEMAKALISNLSEKFGGEDNIPSGDLKTAGRLINAMTGKGDMFNGSKWLKDLLWAPGRLAGQIQMVTIPLGMWYGNTPASDELKAYVKREFICRPLKNAMKFTALMWFVHELLKDGDDDDPFIEYDPRKPQFGKMKIGNRFFSFLGGEESIVRLGAKIGADILPETIGRRNFYGNEPESGGRTGDVLDTVVQFGRGRMSPAASAILSILRGSTYIGEKIDRNRLGHISDDTGLLHWFWKENVIPLSWSDIQDVIWDQTDGYSNADPSRLAAIAPLALLALGGVQGQTYGDSAYRRYEANFDKFADSVKDSSPLSLADKRDLARSDKYSPFCSEPGKFERLKKLRKTIKEGQTILRDGKNVAEQGKETRREPLSTEEHDLVRKRLEQFQTEFVDLVESDLAKKRRLGLYGNTPK